MPQRLQRKRTKGYRAPDSAVYVGRGTKWGNPFVIGETLVRYPGIDGTEWEVEGRSGKTPGERHPYKHPDGSVTWHRIEYATREQVVELYARRVGPGGSHELDVAEVRRELAGKDLLCWCPPGAACHADRLLAIANSAEVTV